MKLLVAFDGCPAAAAGSANAAPSATTNERRTFISPLLLAFPGAFPSPGVVARSVHPRGRGCRRCYSFAPYAHDFSAGPQGPEPEDEEAGHAGPQVRQG